MMKYTLPCLLVILVANVSLASPDLITWKGIYYQGRPNKPGISKEYCQQHTPGTFIHRIQEVLAHPVLTNKGITLDKPTFHIATVDGVYLIHGSLTASKKTDHEQWHDRIHYFLYKYSEAGITQGIWYSKECKGLYKGIALS